MMRIAAKCCVLQWFVLKCNDEDCPDGQPYNDQYWSLVACGGWDNVNNVVLGPHHKHGWQEISGGPFEITSSVMSVILDASTANGRVHADAIWLEREACTESSPYDPTDPYSDYGANPCSYPENPLPQMTNGLAWIVEHQQADGSWQHVHSTSPGTSGPACNGQCTGDGGGGYAGASTAFGILALVVGTLSVTFFSILLAVKCIHEYHSTGIFEASIVFA